MSQLVRVPYEAVVIFIKECQRRTATNIADILNAYPDVNDRVILMTTVIEGHSATDWAFKNGNADIVRMVIEVGLDVTVRVDGDKTYLMLAASSGHLDVVQVLLYSFGDETARAEYINTVSNTDGTASHCAIRNAQIAIFHLLIENGADVTVRDIHGFTLLMEAVSSSKYHRSNIQQLLPSMINVEDRCRYLNARDDRGMTALHCVTRKDVKWYPFGNQHIVKLLISSGADVTLQDNEGMTCLMHVSKTGRVDIVDALLESFADAGKRTEYINIRDKNRNGRSALSFATEHKHTKIAYILRHLGGT